MRVVTRYSLLVTLLVRAMTWLSIILSLDKLLVSGGKHMPHPHPRDQSFNKLIQLASFLSSGKDTALLAFLYVTLREKIQNSGIPEGIFPKLNHARETIRVKHIHEAKNACRVCAFVKRNIPLTIFPSENCCVAIRKKYAQLNLFSSIYLAEFYAPSRTCFS